MTFIQINHRQHSAHRICKSISDRKFVDNNNGRWTYPDTRFFTTFKLEFVMETVTRTRADTDIPF